MLHRSLFDHFLFRLLGGGGIASLVAFVARRRRRRLKRVTVIPNGDAFLILILVVFGLIKT